MSIVPAKCPECNGLIEVDNEKKLGICQLCSQPYMTEEAVQLFHSCYNTNNTNNHTIVNIFENKSNDFVVTGGILKAYNGASVDVVIPDGVVEIAESCFEGLKIKSIVISEGVTHIGDRAFYECDKLISITLPSSLTNIGESSFSGCDALKNVYITDIAAWCAIDFGNCETPMFYAQNLFLNGELVRDLVIPDGVTSINSYAFYCVNSLTSVTIPDSVARIGQFAFNCCSNLKTINISDRVIRLGRGAFKTYWESNGRCSFCGGTFKEGIFSAKCMNCKEKKIY